MDLNRGGAVAGWQVNRVGRNNRVLSDNEVSSPVVEDSGDNSN